MSGSKVSGRGPGRGLLAQCGQLLWLKRRHARTELAWWGYACGMDIVEDRAWFDRAYQVYVLVIVGISAAMGWSALLDMVADGCAAAGPLVQPPLFCLLLFLPVAAFLAAGLQAVGRPPFKLTDADAAFIASGAFETRAMALADGVPRAALTAAACTALGFVLVTGAVAADAGLDAGTLSAHIALGGKIALAMTVGIWSGAAAVAGSAIGYIRLRMVDGRCAHRFAFGAAAVLLMAVVAAFGAMAIGRWAGAALLVLERGAVAVLPFMAAGAVLYSAALGMVSCACAGNLDMARAVEENGAYASLYGVRRMALSAPDVYKELRRRYRVSHRRFRVTVPMGSGPLAPLSRAVQTHLRQFEGLPRLLLVGIVAAPLSAVVLSARLPVFLLFAWGYLLFSCVFAVRELSLAFCEDQRVRLVRDALPFSTLTLAVLDGLPACAAAMLLSLGTMAGLSLLVPGAVQPIGVVLAALWVLTCSLAAALEGIEIPFKRRQPSCAMTLLVVLIVSGVLSLGASGAVALFLVGVDLWLVITIERGV